MLNRGAWWGMACFTISPAEVEGGWRKTVSCTHGKL
jgi:hypothetical protein